jgi:menaquinone-9 beta-reductase
MREKVDVFIVGGGPAGLATAIAARQQGLSVIVADGAQYPIDKPCGEGLIPEAQLLLSKLNIPIPSALGYSFRGLRFIQNGFQVSADYPMGNGLGIRRTVLHELLVERAEKSGVELRWKTPIAGIDKESVRLPNGSVTARWIIGADGGSSRVRRWSNLDDMRQPRRQRSASRRHYRVAPWSEYTEVYWGPAGQAYVTPVSQQEICVVVLAEKRLDGNFAESFKDWPELRERLRSAELSSRERGAITAMHSLRKVFRGNVALVGDAWGRIAVGVLAGACAG